MEGKASKAVDGERIKKYHTDLNRCDAFLTSRFLVNKHLIHCYEPIANPGRFFEHSAGGLPLVQEAFDRIHNNGLTVSPALGACIRHVKVAATAQCSILTLYNLGSKSFRLESQWSLWAWYSTSAAEWRLAIHSALWICVDNAHLL